MKYKKGKLGIVYAISRVAGEFCRSAALKYAESMSVSIDVLTHEMPAEKYKTFYNNLPETKRLVASSIKSLSEDGAQVIFIAANSVHRVFDEIKKDVEKS